MPLRGLPAGTASWAAALVAAALLSGWGLGQVLAAIPDWTTSGLLPDPGWLVVGLAGWLLRPLLEASLALTGPASPWLVLLAFGLPAVATATAGRHQSSDGAAETRTELRRPSTDGR